MAHPFLVMGTIVSLYNRMKGVDIEEISRASIEETKEVIADLNAQQMFHGLRSDGGPILPEYSPVTIEIKKEKGQVTDRVTLRDKGDFYAGIKVEVEGGKVITYSEDIKNDKLFKKYSTRKSNIFGLSPLYRREYINESLRKVFRQKTKAATGL